MNAGLTIFGTMLLALWVGTAAWMARNSSLRSWLRYLDAVTLLPILLAMVLVNLALASLLAPGVVEIAGWFLKRRAFVFSLPFAFVACAPLPILAFSAWRAALRRLDGPEAPSSTRG